MPDALQMLKEDHRTVQDLFKEFEEAKGSAENKRIVTQTIKELEIHTQLEEEIFYPAVWKEAQPEDKLMHEAEEEHHVVDLLIKELRRMQPSAEQYDAKFKVLSENVKHHIQEEESLMLPKAAELGGARMSELGDDMMARKAELTRAYDSRASNGKSPSATRRATAKRVSPAGSGSANGRRTSSVRGATSRRGAAGGGTPRTRTAASATRGSKAPATRARSTASRRAAGARRRAS